MYPPKYTKKQRQAVYELFWLGREDPMPGIRAKGHYTLKEIEQITGVKAGSAWMIARGYR